MNVEDCFETIHRMSDIEFRTIICETDAINYNVAIIWKIGNNYVNSTRTLMLCKTYFNASHTDYYIEIRR